MINIPVFDDIQHTSSSDFSGIKTNHPSEELNKKTENFVRASAIVSYFIRMSWENKLKFLTCLFKKIKCLKTFTLLLKTLQTVTGKLTSYWRSSNTTPIDFDTHILDHDRMFEPHVLTEVAKKDIEWFGTLEDKEQVALIITVMRFGGGAITRQIYGRVQTIYAQHLQESTRSSDTQITTQNDIKVKESSLNILEQIKYDPEDPKHKKVLQLTKEYNDTIEKYRQNVRKLEHKGKFPEKKKDKKKSNEKESKTKNKTKQDEPLDWMGLTPIHIVKQIFNYLDKTSLKRAKLVSSYWKWAVEDYLQDVKAARALNKTINKLGKDCNFDSKLPDCSFPQEPKPRVSHTERRLQKLKRRGAVIEELRHRHLPATDTYALIIQALKRIGEDEPCLENLTMYPRVPRSNSPLYKKPTYIVKDYRIITEEDGDLASLAENVNLSWFSSSLISNISDED